MTVQIEYTKLFIDTIEVPEKIAAAALDYQRLDALDPELGTPENDEFFDVQNILVNFIEKYVDGQFGHEARWADFKENDKTVLFLENEN